MRFVVPKKKRPMRVRGLCAETQGAARRRGFKRVYFPIWARPSRSNLLCLSGTSPNFSDVPRFSGIFPILGGGGVPIHPLPLPRFFGDFSDFGGDFPNLSFASSSAY